MNIETIILKKPEKIGDEMLSEYRMFKFKNLLQRHIAISFPQSTSPNFKHTYPIILATF